MGDVAPTPKPAGLLLWTTAPHLPQGLKGISAWRSLKTNLVCNPNQTSQHFPARKPAADQKSADQRERFLGERPTGIGSQREKPKRKPRRKKWHPLKAKRAPLRAARTDESEALK
jgi:hypothetical protein